MHDWIKFSQNYYDHTGIFHTFIYYSVLESLCHMSVMKHILIFWVLSVKENINTKIVKQFLLSIKTFKKCLEKLDIQQANVS